MGKKIAKVLFGLAMFILFCFVVPKSAAETLAATPYNYGDCSQYSDCKLWEQNGVRIYYKTDGGGNNYVEKVVTGCTVEEAKKRNDNSLKIILPAELELEFYKFVPSEDGMWRYESTFKDISLIQLTIPKNYKGNIEAIKCKIGTLIFCAVEQNNYFKFNSCSVGTYYYKTIKRMNVYNENCKITKLVCTTPEITSSFIEKCVISNLYIMNGVTVGSSSFSESKIGNFNVATNATIDAWAISNSTINKLTYYSKKLKPTAFYETFISSAYIAPSTVEIPAEGYFSPFSSCTITNMVFNASVNKINKSLFSDIKKMTNLKISGKCTELCEWVFWEANITNIKIAGPLKKIGKNAFYNCKAKKIIIPDTVTYIGDSAFSNTQISSITLGEKVTYIGDSAFANTQISSITLGEKVTYIGENVFYQSKITNIVLNCRVSKLKQYLFSEVRYLKTVDLSGSTVNTIEPYTFYNCSNLRYIKFPATLKKIDDCSFAGCNKVEKIILSNGSETFYGNVKWIPTNAPNLTVITPNNYDYFYSFKINEINVARTTNVCLNFDNIYLLKGDKKQKLGLCNAVPTAADKITYTSSDKNVATVDSKGYVNPVGVGTAVISVKFKGKTYKCTVKVYGRTIENRPYQINKNYRLSALPDYHIAKAVFEWLEKYCEYDFTFTKYYESGIMLDYTGVCNSYMLSCNYIFKYFNIPCESLVSWEMNHGWNYIKIAGNWYQMDTTWHLFIMSDKTAQVSGQGAGLPRKGHYGYSAKYTCPTDAVNKTYYSTYRGALITPDITGLKNTYSGVSVSWTKSAYANGYYVYRRAAGKGWQKIATVSGKTTTYIDKSAVSGVNYFYTVVAYRDSVKSPVNLYGKAIKRLSQPKFKVLNAKAGISVGIAPVAGATYYKIYRKAANAKNWVCVAVLNSKTTLWCDKNVKTGVKYSYTVRAFCGMNSSSYHPNGLTVKR